MQHGDNHDQIIIRAKIDAIGETTQPREPERGHALLINQRRLDEAIANVAKLIQKACTNPDVWPSYHSAATRISCCA